MPDKIRRQYYARPPLAHQTMHDYGCSAHAVLVYEAQRALELFRRRRGHIRDGQMQRVQPVAGERLGVERRLGHSQHRANALLAQPCQVGIQRRRLWIVAR
jgi:hypothetical protein